MIRLPGLVIMVLLMIGCSGAPPVPTDHFYRLTLPDTDITQGQLTDEIIYVDSILAEGLYNERALIYTGKSGDNELQQYHYHFWVTSPPKLLALNLVKYLRTANVSPLLVTEAGSGEQITISGKLLAFERIFTNDNSRANIVIEFTITREGTDVPLLIKEYRGSEPVSGDKVAAVVEAYNRGVFGIFNEFHTDLASVLR